MQRVKSWHQQRFWQEMRSYVINKILIPALAQYTAWHENLTVIKFYGSSKLLRERKFADFKFYRTTNESMHFYAKFARARTCPQVKRENGYDFE